MRSLTVPTAAVVMLCLVACLFSFEPSSAAAQFQFGLAHSDSLTSNHHKLASKFAELAEKYSDGRIKITVYPGGQLGT